MYFNEAQIQQMIEKFPTEVKEKFDKVVLKEAIPRKHDYLVPKILVENAIEEDNIVFNEIKNNIVKFKTSFKSLDNYNQPSEEQFKSVLEELKEELSNAFGYLVEVKVKVISFGQEPVDVPPLYFGELDEQAEYSMTIKIFLNTTISSL